MLYVRPERSRTYLRLAVLAGIAGLSIAAETPRVSAQASTVPAAAVPSTAGLPSASQESWDPSQTAAAEQPTASPPGTPPETLNEATHFVAQWLESSAFSGALRTVAAITIISLVPALVLMTTSFIRISIVLGLLRQALGTPMLPSNQVMTVLSMFLTVLIMLPVWTRVYHEAVVPGLRPECPQPAAELLGVGLKPISEFMGRQIDRAGNAADVWLFYDYVGQSGTEPQTYGEVPLPALLPAFVLSELKVAFLIGFQIYLPFLIIDLVVASVSTSLGMMMLPPTMVSLPLKLMMFVLVDGWHLVVQMLLESFGGPL